MAEEEEIETVFSTLKFPLLSATMHSPDHPSGTATPPLQTLASVPFKWEEQPGKPRPCTDIIALPEPAKCLELPPCRILEPTNKHAKMASPTTVLDGPYNVSRRRFSSFRLFGELQGSFDSSSSGGSPESAVDVLLAKKGLGQKTRGFLGKSMRFRSSKREADEGSFLFSPASAAGCGGEGEERWSGEKVEVKMRRNGSFSGFSQARSTHLWASICENLKQVIPWKSGRKLRK